MCDVIIDEQMKRIFVDRFKQNEPMSRHTNFRIGGPAKYFVEAKTEEEVIEAVRIARENGVLFFVMGGGSNLLVADKGFDGLVIKMALRDVKIEGTTVTAGAGVISAALARATAKAGLQGLEWAISLPGTIGGAVRGNAGCFGGETKDAFVSARVLRDGAVVECQKNLCAFGYRESAIKHSTDIVLSTTFELSPGNAKELTARLDELLNKRKSEQPLYAGSAGCVFKNYEIENDKELKELEGLKVPEEMLKARRISAGWLIDECELKGQRIGDAQISEEHGNFIVNLGSATADHVMQLIALAKTRVRDRFGIQLHEEVQMLGFESSEVME